MEYKGRKFTLEIPSPFDGCAIIDTISSYKLPFGSEILFGASKKPSMNAEKLKEFQMLCLKHCFEDLGANKAPIIDAQGHFGIIEATVSAPLLCKLTVGFIDFFMEWWHEETR